DDDDGHQGVEALKALQRARRRNRLATVDRFEALYNVYLAGLLGSLAVVGSSNLAGDRAVDAAELRSVVSHGPAALGLLAALAVAVGIRSGGRGGPLALPPADVRHVLLAPVDRTAALRTPALRQLRYGLFAGTAAGAVAGVNASHRLPRPALSWVAAGAVVGAVTVAISLGAALVVSGRRLGRTLSGLAALVVLAWSGFDLWRGATTSPLTFLGGLALSPLRFRPLDLLGLLPVLAVPLGLLGVGGTSLEASEDRGRLVGQLRFAATLGDVRTVLVLRRQLAQERPRSRPWVRIGRRPLATGIPAAGANGPGGTKPAGLARSKPPVGATGAAGPGGTRPPALKPPARLVVRRSLLNLSRWPAGRLLRLVVLAGGAGMLCAGAWAGTKALIVPAGLCAYLAGLDAIEPLAQQLDHPDREETVPRAPGAVRALLLVVPMVALSLLGLVGILAAVAVGAPVVTALAVGLPAALATGVLACCGAAVSTIKGPDVPTDAALLTPEIAGTRAIFRMGFPPLCGVLGMVPVLFGQAAAKRGLPPGGAAIQALLPLIGVVGGLTLAWVRFREELQGFLSEAGQAAGTGGPRAGSAGG
ncbi:MAG: hypothetical protein ABIS47_13520, partial [Acidimicrobiales bacterium]